MGLRFTVLASGSAGNASVVHIDGFGALIDIGLGPRQLSARLGSAGLSWSAIKAVLLTHTHSDHWKDRSLAYLLRHEIPLYCHPEHHPVLDSYSPAWRALLEANLVRSFEPGVDFHLAPGLRCRPIPLRHDGGATFGFRLEGPADLFGHGAALGYVADLGSWDDDLAEQLTEVDLLAVEFNHDVDLEHASGRTPHLIARVLGDDGHLSNEQAAALLGTVLARSTEGRLKHVVQLHLSQDCNRPALARKAAHTILSALPTRVELHTASQDVPGSTLHLHPTQGKAQRSGPRQRRSARPASPHPWLPGLDQQEIC
jgi:phosphoribosyl 1,2-cyclic phosphodiesterase